MTQLDDYGWQKLIEGKSRDQIRECELLRKLSQTVGDTKAEWDEAVDAYKREIVRAVDYYGLTPEHAGLAAGRTTTRVNQILSELAK